MTRQEAMSIIIDELDRAETKFPQWPVDILHAAAVVAEENGEMQRAALQFVYENGTAEDVRREAIQTAAMALRFLLNFETYDALPGRQTRVSS